MVLGQCCVYYDTVKVPFYSSYSLLVFTTYTDITKPQMASNLFPQKPKNHNPKNHTQEFMQTNTI